VESPVGPLRALLPPITMHRMEPRMDSIPAVGEHTAPILRALGYSDEQIEQLRIEHTI
jgi:crotonobetainyl-CoA:carnitine CoA-transferase CaiB-like acyl-CoA transferase